MKKIAFFVEGQTEQFFLNKLLIEIAGSKNIFIKLKKFKGKGKPTEDILPKTLSQPSHQVNHTVLIYDCAGDGSVKSRILEEYRDLRKNGYAEIVGLRDLYPLPDLQKLTRRLNNGLVINGKRIEEALPNDTSIVVAVREIEEWFLAECNHYVCIDASLNYAVVSSLGFNPCTDDLTIRSNSAALDLHAIYQLAGKHYNKKKDNVDRTLSCLDYTNLYLNVRHKIPKLNDLITKIDAFLS
ncbi:MAG: DUF4276 family protein [Cytophagales bacterium]|nr:MAG: DUF4276 family protein [Cytophagales bacterium]